MTTTFDDNNVQSGVKKQVRQAVEQLLVVLDGTLKKLNLYSESHSIYQDSLNLLKKRFNEFSDGFGNLKIEVDRGQIRYGGDVVHQTKNEPTDFAYILFRDGVIWVEFQAGVELWEIDTFIKILYKYSKLEDDAEDDIVTALWEYDLPSIHYQAADLNLEADEELNISELKCSPEEGKDFLEESADKTAHKDNFENNDGSFSANLAPLSEQDNMWNLTPQEQEELRKMIAEEEKLDGTDYVIEVMIYILEKKKQKDDEVVELLDTLIRELREVLVQGRYTYLRIVLGHLRKYQNSLKSDKHFSAPYLDQFFESLSGETFLSVLSELRDHIENCSPTEFKELKGSLLLLNTSSIQVLGPMLLEITSPKIRKLLMEIIGSMGNRDYRLLEQLINTSSAPLASKLVYILRFLKSQNVRGTLVSLLHHDSELVREEALKTIMALDEGSIQDTFELIEDPDENIRKLLLYRMGQKRNEQIENLLLEYLNSKNYRFKDTDTLFSICRTLGRCGSDRSIPELRKQLFALPAFGILRFKKSKRRQAAVMALKELNTEKAASLVEIDRYGFFRNLLRFNKS